VIRRWLAAHKSLAVTATSASLVVALVTTVALFSGGYTAQRTDLNDASVWVANGSEQFVGRANTEVLELNTVVASDGSDLDVVQNGSTVLLFNRSDATVDVVDAATSEIVESVPLPPNQPEIFLAGDNVVIYAQGTGELWILPVSELAGFDATQEAPLNLGADSVVSVDDAGILYAFSSTAGQVYRVDAAQQADVQSTGSSELSTAAGQAEITSVAGTWIVLDTQADRLDIGGRLVELGEYMGDGGNPRLQRASSTGSSVLVAFTGGLIRVPLDGGLPALVTTEGSGAPAAPVVVGDCEFAAWPNAIGWRHCRGGAASGSTLDLEAMPSGVSVEFKVNQGRTVLNDADGGSSWAVQSNGELIDNWDDLIEVEQDQNVVEENEENEPPVTEKNQLPPVAVDDELGARPGRTSILPVLLNDYDPNGDVLVINTVSSIDPAVGRIDVIDSRQQLQLTLADGARGSVSFSYTISDGRGATDTAMVRVTIRDSGDNAAPRQVRTSTALVEEGGAVTTTVLGDWIDPDGDPFYLASATVAAPDAVSSKPEGAVIFTDSGSGGAFKSVALVVSDGTAEGAGTLAVTVRNRGDIPIIADPFVVLAYSGQEATISPLEHVRGGSGELRLNAVQAQPGVTITPSYETGTFRFSSDQVRTFYLEYVVTDDESTATGLVRVDVAAPPDSNTTPITVPKTVFVTTQSSRNVDVAATDIDPAGGVLLVTGITDIPRQSNVRADVLEQRLVRVTLTGPLEDAVVVKYRVSNGLAEAEGTITVIEVAPPTRSQPPIARDDKATVRVGDAITISVMANDEQPDGEPIRLNPVLVEGLGDDSGLLFASGDTLRYLAPDHTGDFIAQYEILTENGQSAQAELRIQVREPNVETNHAPVPATVTARVLAGKQVRIEIPLDGIDADGDSVQFLGQETNPEKGGVTEVGTTFVVYTAGEYSAGTDTFTYTVMDALGARATGTVRVGISPRLDGARNPVAIEDLVRVRPGATVSVQVLSNDSDPDGSPLHVAYLDDTDIPATIVDGSIVDIIAPSESGDYGLVYTIQNDFGGSSSNFIRLDVDADAPLSYPIAQDTVLTLSDVLDRDTVDVDVLQNVFFADGDSAELGLSLLPQYASSAGVLGDKRIRVTIGDTRQIIPFAVIHPDDSSIRSYAFLWVPGYEDALPQLDKRAPRLVVKSEDTLEFDLNDYVLAVGGKKVRLTDSSSVRATHANGDPLVVDNDTLSFTSADLFFGQASISFEVTDGTSASDPEGRTANLVLPIEVEPRDNQPPVFTGAVIEFEPAQEKVIDLTDLTNYPFGEDDVDELVYSVRDPAPVGFSYEINGQVLTLRADDDAVKGSTTAISLGVRDAAQDGQSGRIELRVVPSTRPLAIPVADSVITKRGETTVVDVLANDQATNPFPGRPLRVVNVRGLDGGSLPEGVSISASSDNQRLTVTISDSAQPIDTTLQYQVSDATRDPDRYVWGTVRISVQDVPDAPVKPVRQADSFVGGELKLRITAPQPNNSPITSYRVSSTSQGTFSQDCGTSLICSLSGLTVGAEYRFTVTATNAIGESEPSPASDPYTVDYRPKAPENVVVGPTTPSDAPNGKSITVSWDAVPDPNPGTPVVGYTVEVKGPGVNYSATATSPFTTSAGGDLSNNTSYTVSVYARNSAQVLSAADWRRTSRTVLTVGPPVPATPGPRAAVNPDSSDGAIRVTWGDSDPNGGGAVSYSIGRVTGTAPTPACTAGPGKPYEANGSGGAAVTSGWVDTATVDGESYTYFVYSDNGSYCTASATGATESKRPPGAPHGSASVVFRNGQYDIRANTDLEPTTGIVAKYQYQLDGGTWRDVVGGQYLTSRSDTSHYAVSTTVKFRACRDDSDDYCGPANAGAAHIPVNARASVSSCVTGIPPEPQQPANAGPISVSYSYSYRGLLGLWSFYTYSESDNVPSEATEVRVKATVTVDGEGYTDQDPDSGESRACG
jgi:hypothetical protein